MMVSARSTVSSTYSPRLWGNTHMVLFLSSLSSLLFNKDERTTSTGIPARPKVSLIVVYLGKFLYFSP